MHKLLLTAAGAAALLYASAASAIPIAGGSELSLNGSDTFTGAVGGSTFTINFINPGNVGGQSGSFSELPNCTGCVTMISTLTQASTNFTLYNVTDPNSTPAGDTSSLTAGSISTFQITAGAGGLENLDVSGPGTLNLTGFDPTPGFYSLTTQGPSGTATVTFSNTSIATGVPEPNTLAILGSALLALGFWWRWRQS